MLLISLAYANIRPGLFATKIRSMMATTEICRVERKLRSYRENLNGKLLQNLPVFNIGDKNKSLSFAT